MPDKQKALPTISRVLRDNTLVELVYDPLLQRTALAESTRDGSSHIVQSISLPTGEELAPYSADNNLIATGCVLLASDIGPWNGKEELLSDLRDFIHTYVDLPEPFEDIAAHYVLLTWVYDAFTDLPYLRFRGDYGTGKTRALLVIGSLAYKAFFASGASTVSPIFHIQDAFQGTLILDEADFRYSDAAAQLTKVLNNGSTKGLPVLRTMTNRNRELNPQAFRVFGPKVVAMRERFSDLALESRFITCETSGRTLRSDVPIHLPECFSMEALALRNRLLAWRFRSRFSVGPDPSRQANALAPRYRQSSWALLSLVDDPHLRDRIARELAGEEARVMNERADSFEAAMLSAVSDTFATSPNGQAPVKQIAARFNAATGDDLGRAMSNRWVAGFLRRLGLQTIRTHGVYVVPPCEQAKLQPLAARFGVEPSPMSPGPDAQQQAMC
jgi:hypothetical protein